MAAKMLASIIASAISLSASPDAGRVCAIVLLAGATARHHANPINWNGDVEKQLALHALGGTADEPAGFAAADKQAVVIVRDHWQEITAIPESGVAPSGLCAP
jgi:hypothetical protein